MKSTIIKVAVAATLAFSIGYFVGARKREQQVIYIGEEEKLTSALAAGWRIKETMPHRYLLER